MVRLKSSSEFPKRPSHGFQFHYGSIKMSDGIELMHDGIGFNSTMVRLKYRQRRLHYLYTKRFNSTMVRLKSCRVRRRCRYLRRFNSTMVRLKSHFAPLIAFFLGFQFHYGSIKIEDFRCREVRGRKFQFHYGSIKMGRSVALNWSPSKFQFHYGSIKMAKRPFALILP